MNWNLQGMRLAKIGLREKLKHAVCGVVSRHTAVFPTVEKFPAGSKPWRMFKCWCGVCHREKYAAQLDSEFR